MIQKICLVIGDPIAQSLSPIMHSAGYKALGIEKEFAFHAARVPAENLKQAIDGMRGLGLRGFACTIPHKVAVIPLLDQISEEASKIGAVNTVVNENGNLVGYNTDYLGITKSIVPHADLVGLKALVLGAGGASRAACFGLTSSGAQVTVANRSIEKGARLAADFGANFIEISALKSLDQFDLILNTTPVGMGNLLEQSPINPALLQPRHIVFDTVYRPKNTALISAALKCGSKIIYGLDMLLHQGLKQFELFTSIPGPETVMRNAIYTASEA